MQLTGKTMSNIKPITQTELTDNDINYSIKIGKQVITTKLKEARTNLGESTKLFMKELNELCDEQDTKQELKEKFYEAVDNNSSINYLRLAWNEYNEYEHEQKATNRDMIKAVDFYGSVNIITCPSNHSVNRYKNMIDKLSIDIPFELYGSVNPADEDEEYISAKHYLPIDLPSAILPNMLKRYKVLQKIEANDNEMTNIDKKLYNINDTMEQMEAKLLIQELKRTGRGEEVLKISSDIISDVLNETLSLTDET